MDKRKYWESIPGSMFDFIDFYRRIAQQLPDNCRIVEVGVADGKSAIFLAEELLNLGKAFQLTMVDNCGYGGFEQRNEIIRNITKAGIGEYTSFLEMDSLAASCKFNDHALDFVFLDSSHRYEETKAEIRLWYRKVIDGGILAGHDYTSIENAGVKQAVDEVIPSNFFCVEPTGNNCGVWSILKKPHYNI